MTPIRVLTAVLLSVSASTAFAKDKPPEVDVHGLHLVHGSELRLV